LNTKTKQYVDNNRNTETNANFEETVLFYIMFNVFENFLKNFEKITANINEKLKDYLDSSQHTLVSFNLTTLIFGILLIFIVWYSIKNYRQRILKLIFDIFIKDKIDPLFLDKLKNFMTIAKDFDKKICLDFEEENKRIIIEELLNYDPQLLLNEDVGKNMLNTNNFNSNDYIYNNNNFNNNTNLNNSVNNSTLQLLNIINSNTNNINNNIKISNNNNNGNNNSTNRRRMRTKNQKDSGTKNIGKSESKNKNNSGTVSDNRGINSDVNVESAQNRNERKFANDLSNINMVIIKIFYIILAIAFCGYMALSLSNISINKTQYKSLLIANQISLNFIDRIPKFAELILYYRISVIFNNVNFIETPQESYKSLVYSDYFNQHFTPETETLFKALKESKFSHIYYNLLIIRKNIDMFMRSDDAVFSSILPSIRKYEKKMNSPEFCAIYRINNKNLEYDFKSANLLNTVLDSFAYLNFEAKECLKIGNGINKYGINIALNSLLASTKNLYMDFFRAGENANITRTLTDKNFIRGVTNNEFTFFKANINYRNIILKDMTELYDGIKKSEFIFSCTWLAFNCVFILFVIFGVIRKLQNYFLTLKSAIDKFKVVLIVNEDNFKDYN
jgi:hypothetical protein